ncbi:MAG: hypothetical protein QXD77_00695 [Candidatus Aenigmatarchaeota archaeon]
MAKKTLVAALTTLLAVALAAGAANAADEGPPGIINVDGAVYYTGGVPVDACTPVTVELRSPTGEIKQKKELCTGQYFPPLGQYSHMYKLTFAGSPEKDTVVVKALGITNSSVAQVFTVVDITGPKPGIVSDIGKAVNYIIGMIVPKKATETPMQPGQPVQSESPASQQPAVPDDVAGASFLLIITMIAAAFIIFVLKRKKSKGTASHRPQLALFLVSIVLLGSLWFWEKDAITVLSGEQAATGGGEGVAPTAANQTQTAKNQIIVEGGFPTGKAVEGGEEGAQLQVKYSVNVNDPDIGFIWGPNGEYLMNTTWANWTFIAADAYKCGDKCNPMYGNCTILNVSLIRNNASHTLIQNRTVCGGQGYPWNSTGEGIYLYYYRFKTVLTTEDNVGQDQYTVNITANNYTFVGRNGTIGAEFVYIDVTLSEARAGVPPIWSQNQSSVPSVYNPTNASNFTIKWTDNGAVTTVYFESNFSGAPQNYTITNFTPYGDYGYADVLPAGNFYWKSYAIDNTGDQAVSDTWYFTILQADNPVTLFFRNSTGEYVNQDMTITYPAQSNATATAVAGATLYRNDVYTGGFTEADVLGAGAYAYKANATGNQNYSANFTGVTYNLYINQAANPVTLTLNGQQNNIGVSYGTPITPVASGPDGVGLYKNDTTATSGQALYLAAGDYAFKANSTGNQNYTANATGVTYYATVSQATPSVSVGFVPSNSVQYGTSTTATCTITTGDPAANLILLRNGTQVGSGAGSASETNTLGGGIYNYTCVYQASQNYTAGYSYNNYLTVTPAPANVLQGTMHVLINGTEEDKTYKYENVTNVTGYSTVTGQSGLTFNLYRNAQSAGSSGSEPYEVSDVKQLGALTYTYVYNTTGNENYSAASVIRTLTIEKKTPTLSLGTAGAVNYGTPAGVSGSATVLPQADYTINLYVNGLGPISTDSSYPYSVSDNTVYGAGSYTFTLNNSASANYSAASATAGLTVNQIAPTLELTVTPSNSVMYPTITNATGTVVAGDPSGNTQLWRNSTYVGTSTETNRLGAGHYNYTFAYLGSQNYTASSITNMTIVQQNTSNPLNLYINNGTLYVNQDVIISYGTSVTVQGLEVFAQSGTVNLYRNGQSTTNPVTITLGGGSHAFKANSTGNENYTANATGATYNVIVNKALPATSITFQPSNSETYGTQTTATCSVTTGDPGATLRLYRNGTEVNMSLNSVSETNILGAGPYNYSCFYQATENYTAYWNIDVFLTISQAASTCSLSINPPTPITYGTATNASCACTGTGNLYRNHSNANAENNVNTVLPAGFWNYTCNSTANQNYTAASTSQGYQVNQAAMPLQLLLNGTDGNREYLNGTFANFTITTGVSGLPVQLFTNYSNGVNKLWDSGNSPFSNITNLSDFGVWNFTAYYAGNQNYSANSTTRYAAVSEMRPNPVGNLTILLNTTSEEIILNWTLSNSSDIFNYIIYVTDNYDAGFNFSNPYATTPNDTTNWTDPTSDGVNERYYIVRANNSVGVTDLNTYTVGKFNLKLYTGWNLISLPLLMDNPDMVTVIYTADYRDICERYNPLTSTYERTDFFDSAHGGPMWSGEFDTMNVDRGYWYFSRKAGYETTPFNVTIVGTVPTATRQEQITANAWSLLGWTSIHTKTLDSVFTQSQNKDILELYEPVTDVFQRTDYFGGLGWFGEFDYITPGYGYWYYSRNATAYNWTYQP